MTIFGQKLKLDPFTFKWTVILLGLFALQAGGTYAVMASNDLLNHFKPTLYFDMLYYSLALIVTIKILSYYFKFRRYPSDKKNIIQIQDDFQISWLNINYLFAFLVPMICLPTFMSLFSSMKSTIHLIQPFYLDEFLAQVDHLLHLGNDPWRITHAVFGTAYLSAFINYLYNLWFFIMFGFTMWHVVNVKSGKQRMQYLLSFVIAWPLLGSIFAVFLSSAGPVYYGDVVGDPTVFGPMMENLREYHSQFNGKGWGIFALDTQDMLWADYLKSDTNIGSGISAMPSMHVAIAALLYFSAKDLNRIAGYFMLVFLIFIQIGSVHLGWHYAVDGYVSIILMYILWRIVGFMVNKISD